LLNPADHYLGVICMVIARIEAERINEDRRPDATLFAIFAGCKAETRADAAVQRQEANDSIS